MLRWNTPSFSINKGFFTNQCSHSIQDFLSLNFLWGFVWCTLRRRTTFKKWPMIPRHDPEVSETWSFGWIFLRGSSQTWRSIESIVIPYKKMWSPPGRDWRWEGFTSQSIEYHSSKTNICRPKNFSDTNHRPPVYGWSRCWRFPGSFLRDDQWWFQPICKIWVELDHLHQVGMKMEHLLKPPREVYFIFCRKYKKRPFSTGQVFFHYYNIKTRGYFNGWIFREKGGFSAIWQFACQMGCEPRDFGVETQLLCTVVCWGQVRPLSHPSKMNIKSEDVNMVGKKIYQPVNYLNLPIWLEIPCFPIGPPTNLPQTHRGVVNPRTTSRLPGGLSGPLLGIRHPWTNNKFYKSTLGRFQKYGKTPQIIH